MTDLVVPNGIDITTGDYLLAPAALEAVAARLSGVGDEAGRYLAHRDAGARPHFGLPIDVEPVDVARAGWAVVFATDEDPDVRRALEPLIDHRARQVAADRIKVLDYRAGESFLGWLGRHRVQPGTVDPTRVPYYVALVGSPARIPFDFQYLLDVEYAVGRIDLDAVRGYERYVATVVAWETGEVGARDRTVAFFATEHPDDPATALSAGTLVEPLASGGEGDDLGVAERWGYATRTLLRGDATRGALLGLLGGEEGIGRPGLLFTASHGVGCPSGDPNQTATNGALLCQEWPGGPVRPEHLLSADQLAGAALHGLVAFFFACYSAGTPQYDEFPEAETDRPVVAPAPFTAALPQAMLGHPDGGALAVVGHVERVWGNSYTGTAGPQLQPFRNALGHVLLGRPVGHAMTDFNQRFATLSSQLANELRTPRLTPPLPAWQLVSMWLERSDAQNYVVLGDPAVRMPPPV